MCIYISMYVCIRLCVLVLWISVESDFISRQSGFESKFFDVASSTCSFNILCSRSGSCEQVHGSREFIFNYQYQERAQKYTLIYFKPPKNCKIIK